MKISELNAEYDKLQLQYGAKELTSIYNGGCTNNPDFCFVFMNPTGDYLMKKYIVILCQKSHKSGMKNLRI